MSRLRPYNISGGFSLIEILVVVALVSILAMVGMANFSATSASARDAERQTDLKNLQNALETYKNRVGRYPAGCKGPDTWSGQIGTSFACTGSSSSQYIVGLAPEYISVLPADSKLNGLNSGYVYRTNTEGTVYKVKAYNTVESEVVTRNHPLKPCDIRADQNTDGFPINLPNSELRKPNVVGWCAYESSDLNSLIAATPACNAHNTLFSSSYAVWGGLASLDTTVPGIQLFAADPLASVTGANENNINARRFFAIGNTRNVICQ